jgi:hypothetical protein
MASLKGQMLDDLYKVYTDHTKNSRLKPLQVDCTSDLLVFERVR